MKTTINSFATIDEIIQDAKTKIVGTYYPEEWQIHKFKDDIFKDKPSSIRIGDSGDLMEGMSGPTMVSMLVAYAMPSENQNLKGVFYICLENRDGWKTTIDAEYIYNYQKQ